METTDPVVAHSNITYQLGCFIGGVVVYKDYLPRATCQTFLQAFYKFKYIVPLFECRNDDGQLRSTGRNGCFHYLLSYRNSRRYLRGR